MYTFNWDDIIDLARLYADERQAGYITSTELDRLANAKARILHARGIDRGATAHRRLYSWAATSGVAAWSDSVVCGETSMLRLDALGIVWTATEVEPIRRITNGNEAAALKRSTWGRFTPKGYLDNGREITFIPTPNANASITSWYWKPWYALTYSGTSSATCVEPEAFDEALALDCAVSIRRMSDQETGGMERSLAAALQRFDIDAGSRSHAEPERMHDDGPEGSTWASDLYLPRA